VRAGDVLLERWQKEGIGHTIPVFRVTSPIDGKLAIEVATGSMPRRQPKYEDALQARYYFTMSATGGEGSASDGTPYAKLGGGIRRWRVAVAKGGRWQNAVPAADRVVAISDSDVEAIAARPKRFDELLITGSVDEQEAALTAKIQSSREHLLQHPASCSARETREKAFEALYALAPQLGKTTKDIDDELRTTDDYVFGELEYEKSKTCCWNSTTPAMAEIILDLAREEKEAADAEGVCRAPTVFRAQADGYQLWADHAAKMGRADDWLAWSEDEPCAQKDVAEDAIASFEGTPLCAAN
jgi:ribosomal protein S15P/S13E